MTRIENPSPLHDLHLALAHLITRFGLRRIALALLKEAFKPTRRPIKLPHTASDHLRRDIGLPPQVKSPDRWNTGPF